MSELPSMEELRRETDRLTAIRNLAVTIEAFRNTTIESLAEAYYRDIQAAEDRYPGIWEEALQVHRAWLLGSEDYGCHPPPEPPKRRTLFGIPID